MVVRIVDAPSPSPQAPAQGPMATPIAPPAAVMAPAPPMAREVSPPPPEQPMPPPPAEAGSSPPPDFAALTARETAVIEVNGQYVYEWESVWVQHRWAEAYPLFRFTRAEEVPVPSLWTQAQFKPGDFVAIFLGGQLAVSGRILIWHTAFAAEHHQVMLQGVGLTWQAAGASHIDKDGNFDGMTFMAIVDRVLAPFGIKALPVGTPNGTPFKQAQISPGETIWDFFERLGRDVGAIVGSDQYGNFLIIWDHVGKVTAELTEGINILRCEAIITVENWFNEYIVRGQMPASDDTNGAAASEQEAIAPGRLGVYRPLLTPSEQPVDSGMLQLRAYNEAKWHEGTWLQVVCTVQGWFRPDGLSLWMAGDDVMFSSPSAMINQVMKIQTATFTQDRGQGTLTTLELVAPWLLNDISDIDVRNPNTVPRPGQAVTNTKPPETPPPATQ